jgi:hypothetical protein
MTEQNDDNKIQEEIDDTFTNYFQKIKEKNATFRSNLEDKYCKKIYDKLLLEAPLKKQVIRPKFRYNEIYKLVRTENKKSTLNLHPKQNNGMTKPTLNLHLKHLEQKGFITKHSKTKYKTSYQINVITEPKVVQIQKTIFGKKKLKLVDITRLKKGVFYLPPNLKLVPTSEIPLNERLHYKD